MAVHCNASPRTLEDKKILGIEKVLFENDENLEERLLSREAYWTAQIFTLKPYGMNNRNELRLQNRVTYDRES